MKKTLIIFTIIALLLIVIPDASARKLTSGGRAPAHKFVSTNPSNSFDFYLSANPRDHFISGGSSSQFTINDILFDHQIAGTVDHEADIAVSTTPAGSFGVYSSANPAVATVSAGGSITRVSDGVAKINFKVVPTTGKYLTKQISYTVSRTSGGTTNVFNSYVAGSLAKYLYDNIDSRINGVTASDATTKLWSTEDQATPTYVWNVNFWGYGTDLTPISPWNSQTDCCGVGDHARRAGVLISPRHIAFANHYAPNLGTQYRFIKQDGTVVTRTMTNEAQVFTAGGSQTDIEIGVLDSDVPAGISFAKVLPANYVSYLPSLTSTTTVPTLNLMGGAYSIPDTDKQGYIKELYQLTPDGYGGVGFEPPTIAHRLTFFPRDYMTGDSGNGSFLIINNQLVLLDTTTSFGGFGPNYAAFITQINSVMASLGGGYSLTTIDLSAFNTY